MTKKRKLIIVIFVVILVALIGLIIQTSVVGPGSRNEAETGGPGKPQSGYVFIEGLNDPLPSEPMVTLGGFMSLKHQEILRTTLEDYYASLKEKDEYTANVDVNSVNINYLTDDITFTLNSQDPKSTNLVRFNTDDDYSLVLMDEQGMPVTNGHVDGHD